MEKILAMILAGGRVDELGVLTLNRPKSAVSFGGMFRIIDFPLSNLMHSGIERVGILLQYRSSSLIRHIGNGSSWDMVGRNRGVFILPPYKAASSSFWYRGTADAIYQNFDFIDEFNPDMILILSGDHIYKMDYTQLIEYHKSKNADLTIVFTRVNKKLAHRFGLAEIDDEDHDIGGRIINYKEKPRKPISSWASLTIYLFKTAILKDMLYKNEQQNVAYEFGRDLIPRIINQYRVYGYKFYGYWGYTRTIAEFWQANMDILGDTPKIDIENWGVRTNLDHRAIRDRIPTLISSKAVIKDSLIPHGCKIEGRVSHSVLFPGVEVKKGAVVNNSILMFDSIVCEQAVLENVILDTNSKIGKCAHLGYDNGKKPGFTLVGAHTEIPSNIRIGKNCTIYPK